MMILNMILGVLVLYSCMVTYSHLRKVVREQYLQDVIDRKLLIRQIRRNGIQVDDDD